MPSITRTKMGQWRTLVPLLEADCVEIDHIIERIYHTSAARARRRANDSGQAGQVYAVDVWFAKLSITLSQRLRLFGSFWSVTSLKGFEHRFARTIREPGMLGPRWP